MTPARGLSPQPPMPCVYKMITTVILKNRFDLGFGLGTNSRNLLTILRLQSKDRGMVRATST